MNLNIESTHLPTVAPVSEETNFFFILEHLNQWSFVFAIFAIEALLCTIVILPLPISWRKWMLEKLSHIWRKNPRVRIIIKVILGFVIGFFCDAARRMYLIHWTTAAQQTFQGKDIDMTLFISQRNALLCGATVFLSFMLYRFQSMVEKITQLEEDLRKSEHTILRNIPDLLEKEKPFTNEQLVPEPTKKERVRTPILTKKPQVVSDETVSKEVRQRITIKSSSKGASDIGTPDPLSTK